MEHAGQRPNNSDTPTVHTISPPRIAELHRSKGIHDFGSVCPLLFTSQHRASKTRARRQGTTLPCSHLAGPRCSLSPEPVLSAAKGPSYHVLVQCTILNQQFLRPLRSIAHHPGRTHVGVCPQTGSGDGGPTASSSAARRMRADPPGLYARPAGDSSFAEGAARRVSCSELLGCQRTADCFSSEAMRA